MQSEEAAQISKFRMLISMMLSPGTVLKKAVSGLPFQFSLIVSGSAFLLFFLQTGIDLYKTGRQSFLFVIITALAGAAFGVIAVPAVSALVWVISRAFGCKKGIKWTVSAFCLSYSGALIYCVLGMMASLTLGWRSSVAFGVTGVLWALGPINSIIREMVGGKIYLCVILSAATGALVLFCWSFIGSY